MRVVKSPAPGLDDTHLSRIDQVAMTVNGLRPPRTLSPANHQLAGRRLGGANSIKGRSSELACRAGKPAILTEGFPALPDFEYAVRRNAKPSMAADRLRDVIIDYFPLAAALRRTSDDAERGRVRSASGIAS
jgi:hypothetical protein